MIIKHDPVYTGAILNPGPWWHEALNVVITKRNLDLKDNSKLILGKGVP